MPIINIKNNENKLPIDYRINAVKTKSRTQNFSTVQTKNCRNKTAKWDILRNYEQHNHTDKTDYTHVIHTFLDRDKISSADAQNIASAFMQLYGDFQIVAATHNDTKCIHNHYVISPIDYHTGEMFNHNEEDIRASLLELTRQQTRINNYSDVDPYIQADNNIA